jgi:hypothetical protein
MSLASQQQTPQDGKSVPRLAEPFEPSPSSTPRAGSDVDEKQKKKRSLFGFGKKKSSSAEPGKSIAKSEPTSAPSRQATTATAATSRSNTSTTSPIQPDYARFPSSPGRGLSSSPRLASPAGSQIFERDVQESQAALVPNSPAIPAHITTENYIPPVLDASSEAITDDHLNPDSVEIVTHAQHQPAAVTVTGAPSSFDGSGSFLAGSAAGGSGTWADELAAFAAQRDLESGSNYGSLDNATADVRRLSFISFADVVQSEQAGHAGMAGSRDSVHLAGLTSLSSTGAGNLNRSPSPIRSPVSSSAGIGPGTSPPTSNPGSIKGLELSPARKPIGSPTTTPHGLASPTGPTISGDLNIETMSQALRRTGSGDLSGVRSLPASPI